MPTLAIQNVRLAGLAAAVPPLEEMSWDELGLGPEQCATARRHRETPYRRKARPEQCQSDFCVAAAEKLLAELGWPPAQIDVVLMATLTPDYPIPATAIIVQDRLGIPKTAVAFDLTSGGLGFLHGLQVAASLISAGFLKKALLLTGEVSKTPESSDGDGLHHQIHGHSGSVCALEFAPGAPRLFFDSGGDGATFAALHMPVGGVRNPPRSDMFDDPAGVQFASDYVLDAEKMGAVARRELPASVRRVLAAAGQSIAALDGAYFNPMALPVEADLRRSLGLPPDKFHSFVHEFGGSGSGSIPLALLARSASRLRAGRHTALLGALGGGLAWSSAVLATENLVCPDLLEV